MARRSEGEAERPSRGREWRGRTSSVRSLVLGVLSTALCVACGQREPEVAPGDITVHDTEIVLEACDGDSAERYDADEDGRPEMVVFGQGGRPFCKRLDLDDDGTPDRVTFFDEQGRVRRIESDFDRDRRVDEISIFENGTIKQKWRATVLRGQLDTWEYFERGVRTRSERDADGDGVVDQWWDYSREDCPLIHSDVNGDGLADPGATIDYCKEVGEGGLREGKFRQDGGGSP